MLHKTKNDELINKVFFLLFDFEKNIINHNFFERWRIVIYTKMLLIV